MNTCNWIFVSASTFIMLITLTKRTFAKQECERYDHMVEERPSSFRLAIQDNYTKEMPPRDKGCPAVIKVTLFLRKIGEISISTMTVEVDMMMVLKWSDYRVNWTAGTNATRSASHFMLLTAKEAKKLWTPEVRFRNGMGGMTLAYTSNHDTIKINKEQLQFEKRAAERFHCNFQLASYPLDIQTCAVEVQARNFKSSVILRAGGVRFGGLMTKSEPSEFKVQDFQSGACTNQNGEAEFCSCVEYRFTMHRQISNYIMMVYAPSFLVVILCWISFWLDVDASAPRVTLGLTCLLTLATQFSRSQRGLPAVSYVKAIDVWMFACILIVFGSLLEFAVANYTARKRNRASVLPASQVRVKITTIKSLQRTSNEDMTIDRVSRVAFPLLFLLFNLIYWTYYSYMR